MAPRAAMRFLLEEARRAGAEVVARHRVAGRLRTDADIVIDCRGLAARGELADLRGVRGERLRAAHARGRLASGRCGSCIRATRSTSCRGATASSWSAPP